MLISSDKTILVVDDSIDNQILLRSLLESEGCRVLTASDGKEALLLLSEMPKLPDLIFLDAQMPVMDGFEFRKKQSECTRIRSIPVVVISANADEGLSEKMIFPQRILQKPLQLESVIDCLYMTLISPLSAM